MKKSIPTRLAKPAMGRITFNKLALVLCGEWNNGGTLKLYHLNKNKSGFYEYFVEIRNMVIGPNDEYCDYQIVHFKTEKDAWDFLVYMSFYFLTPRMIHPKCQKTVQKYLKGVDVNLWMNRITEGSWEDKNFRHWIEFVK